MSDTFDAIAQPNTPLLLDGGMGRELRFRGVEISPIIWSASALITDPDIVLDVHRDYVNAGADIITTNTYGIIRPDLEKEGIGDRVAELNVLAAELAVQAKRESDRPVLVAGSLPPLFGSYRPDLVRPNDEIIPLYREQAELLAPFVDFFLCETMSSGAEGHAAASSASATGKSVWVSWTLHEDRSGHLRSGETIGQAVAALGDLPVSGYLVNCCAPESITAALPELSSGNVRWFGGYANTFQPVPLTWTLAGVNDSDGLIGLRDDLSPAEYLVHVEDWLAAGATVVGGCCGTRPAHVALIHNHLQEAMAVPGR